MNRLYDICCSVINSNIFLARIGYGLKYRGNKDKQIEIVNMLSDDEWESLYCLTKKTIYHESMMKAYRATYYSLLSKNTNSFDIFNCGVYYYELNDACVYSGSNVIQKDNRILINDLCDERVSRVLYANFSAAKAEIGRNLVVAYKREINVDRGVYIGLSASLNYYHFVYEILTRLVAFLKTGAYIDYPILVDARVSSLEPLNALLNLVKGTHDIVWIDTDTKYRIGSMVYISPVSHLPTNLKPTKKHIVDDYSFCYETLWDLREHILTHVDTLYQDADANEGEMLYLARYESGFQRLKNDREIAKVFAERGYKVVFPEKLSIYDQIIMFRKARVIAGCEGAAFSNVLFCKPGTRIICFAPREYNSLFWSTHFQTMRLDAVFIDTDICKKSREMAGNELCIDPRIVLSLLDGEI